MLQCGCYMYVNKVKKNFCCLLEEGREMLINEAQSGIGLGLNSKVPLVA